MTCFCSKSWVIPINDDNICPWIISDRLPYPVGGTTPVIGRLFYVNLIESSSALKMFSFGSSLLVFQGLTNGTFKLVSISSIKQSLENALRHLFFSFYLNYTDRQKVR